MEPKALPPSKINPAKLLKGTSGLSTVTKKISTKSLNGADGVSGSDALIIKKQVIQIKDLIKTSTLLKQQEETTRRKETEQKRLSEKEEKLERQEKPKGANLKFPSLPKLGFLDRVKQFLFNLILGKIALALLPQLPKLTPIVSTIFTIQNNVIDWTGKILDGFVTFVDKGYEAYDKSRNFLKNVGGEKFAQAFDGFLGTINNVIEASIIAALAFSELGGDSGGFGGKRISPRKGFDITGRRVGTQAQERYLQRYGEKQFAERFGEKAIQRVATKGAEQTVERGALRTIVKRIPIVGALLDFALNYFVFKEPLGEAAFRAAGSTLVSFIGGVIGSIPILIPFGGPLIGAALGGLAGDALSSALYDMIFKNQAPPQPKVQGRAQGGSVTRGGKLQTAPTRAVKKTPVRQITPTPSQLQPGSDIGGEDKIAKVFPKVEDDAKSKGTVNPLGYIEDVYKTTSKINYFGPLFGLVVKRLAGDKIDTVDYKNVGLSLNAWMNNTFSGEVLRTGGAFAGGGEVNARMFMQGEDLSNVIAKSVEESVSSKLDKVIDDLEKQLMLKPKEGEEKKGAPTPSGAGEYSPEGIQGDIYQYLLSKGLDDAHALGIMANISRESGFRPGASQSGGPGVGLFQYSSAGRKDAFLKAVPDYATNWKAQIDYALKEDAAPRYLIMKFSSPEEAADWWMRNWERPAEYIQATEGPRIHKEYLASLEKFRTKKGYQIPTSADISLGSNIGNLNLAKQLAESMGVPLYSHVRKDNPSSYHYDGRAMDFSNDAVGTGTPQQLALAKELVKRYGSTAKEIFYTPLGFSIKNGKKVAPIAASGHYNHVHVAFAKGGKVHGFTRAILGEEGPEFVIDADSTAALEQNVPGFLDALNKADYNGALSVLRNYASYEFGAETQVVITEKMIPILFPLMAQAQSISPLMSSGDYSGGSHYMDYSYKQG